MKFNLNKLRRIIIKIEFNYDLSVCTFISFICIYIYDLLVIMMEISKI